MPVGMRPSTSEPDPGPGPDDEEPERLIRAARAGDAGAREELLARHLHALTAFVRLRLGDALRARETSQDLVQSVCREVLADIATLDVRGAAGFKRWLFLRAENKIRDRARFWRRDKRDPRRERPLDAPRNGAGEIYAQLQSLRTPSRQLASREEVERLEAAFAELSPDHREVILLARVMGLSHADVAREMGRSTVATRTLLSRALALLATKLG